MGERAFIGLGSNVGDRLDFLARAVRELDATDGVRFVRSSRVYETDPVGGPPQGDFLNAVVQLETMLSPRELLAACLRIEDALGRRRRERWGPREIDLDVLTYGKLRVEEPGLRIPHPRMHERGFVMVPLLELEADPPLPGGRRTTSLRLGPDVLSGVRLYAPALEARVS